MAMSKEDHDNFQRRERERSRTISAKRIKSSNLIDWAMFKVNENSFRCPICDTKRKVKMRYSNTLDDNIMTKELRSWT